MANKTERIGVSHCDEIASRNNWLFREQPINDIGIDAHMEFIDELGLPKQLIALQIKSGESYFNEIKDDFVVFRDINERQYNYWINNSLPCIIVLYNPTTNQCIWQKLTEETILKTSNGEGKGYFIKIPLNQLFIDKSSNNELLKLSKLPEDIANYNFLLSQKEFMEIIKNGGEVKLHSIEWVNKSSGRGETELIVSDGQTIKQYSYPYWFPYTPYEEVFPRLFPWASFSPEETFYEDYDISIWKDLHCFYDKEDDEYINVGDTFKEFRSKLKPIRSIEKCSGEVAEYMLILTLNELGEAFLKVNDFLSKKIAYSDTKPELKE